MNLPPLVIDLDGTLIRTDMLHESALGILRDNPSAVLRMPFWLMRGKAFLKQKLAQRSDFDPSSLPFNQELLLWLKEQKLLGRLIILCTASDQLIANKIAQHLAIFDDVMASDGNSNLAGKNKACVLQAKFGVRGFDYVGNSHADLKIWQIARKAIVVNASNDLFLKASKICSIEMRIDKLPVGFNVIGKLLRVHQWLKNLLLFIPLFAAHQIANVNAWWSLILAFIAFSLCASTVYIANDLLDLESDRQHPRKRFRPFASGAIPVWVGVIIAPLILMVSLTIAKHVGGSFLPWLLIYFTLTCCYSWGLKRLALMDCLALAVLYTLRIVAGAAAANMALSFWLLAFSVFLFLSLAFVKRYAELQIHLFSGKEKLHGRGYMTSDASLLQMLGIASGYASVVVLALYLNSNAVLQLYRTPEFIWGTVPVMLYWISRIWLHAHRGEMHDDPVIFAVKDKASLFAGALFAVIIVLGSMDWPW